MPYIAQLRMYNKNGERTERESAELLHTSLSAGLMSDDRLSRLLKRQRNQKMVSNGDCCNRCTAKKFLTFHKSSLSQQKLAQ